MGNCIDHLNVIKSQADKALKHATELDEEVRKLRIEVEQKRLEIKGMEMICDSFLRHLKEIFSTNDVKFHRLLNNLQQANGLDIDFS